MLRIVSSLCCLAAFQVAAHAQCFESNFGVLCPRGAFPPGYGDDVLFDLQPMNLVFPMGGVAASYTHAHIQSNGVVFLTNGAASGETTTGYSGNATTQLNNLRGTAGAPPRIAVLWRDLDMQAGNGGGVYFNNTLPGRFVVTWADAVQFNTVAPVFTIQAQLFATGEVTFYYSSTAASSAAAIVGVSEGNAIAAVPGVDLSVGGNSGSTKLLYERFAAGAFDLANHCVGFEPSGGGYMQSIGLPAAHTPYGQGCYEFALESFYQPFANAAAAAAALTGQSMVWTPTANGYLATWGGGTYQPPPGGAAVLAVGDDDEVTVTPSTPLPSPFGAASDLRVHGNAIISLGASPQTFPGAPNNYTPTPSALLGASQTAFWSWHDYNTNEAGSGDVTYHEAVVSGETIGYVTWDDVESWSQPGQANRSTLQFQLNLTTGVVTLVWVDIDDNGTSPYGSGHLIGFSPGGPSFDPGPVTLATALPIQTMPDLAPLSLSAAPAPVSTTTSGTLVTYTTSNIPEAAPGSGVYLGANILSFAGVPEPGVGLSFLGAPNCFAHILTINLIQAMVGAVPTLSVTLSVPAGVPEGTEIFSQSIALVVPFSLPNGQNAYGLTTSNGLRTRVSSF
ncbi:MAG TPA: hypothetical protein VFZ65_05565 [Planctomycetota bacterium]|nr:hypothetical protein [Planctomycetota bacterium]